MPAERGAAGQPRDGRREAARGCAGPLPQLLPLSPSRSLPARRTLRPAALRQERSAAEADRRQRTDVTVATRRSR